METSHVQPLVGPGSFFTAAYAGGVVVRSVTVMRNPRALEVMKKMKRRCGLRGELVLEMLNGVV